MRCGERGKVGDVGRREVRHLGVEEDERGDRLDVVQLRQQRGEVAAVRQRRPRHRRAVLVKLGLRGILRPVSYTHLRAHET